MSKNDRVVIVGVKVLKLLDELTTDEIATILMAAMRILGEKIARRNGVLK